LIKINLIFILIKIHVFYKEDEDYSSLSLWIVEEKIIQGKYFINKKIVLF